MKKVLIEQGLEMGIEISSSKADLFIEYMNFALAYNRHTNLTAIEDEREFLEKHFIDSLVLLRAFSPEEGSRLIDVGSGAGFPGIPILIMRPDLRVTLLDSANKRISFLKELCLKLSLDAEFLCMRSEEAASRAEYREKYDIVTARAVASLPSLSELCLPLVKLGGAFIALKGPGAVEELDQAKRAIDLFGGGDGSVYEDTLPGGERRGVVVIHKTGLTPENYPRSSNAILKRPFI